MVKPLRDPAMVLRKSLSCKTLRSQGIPSILRSLVPV
jgi:hypothetical protein